MFRLEPRLIGPALRRISPPVVVLMTPPFSTLMVAAAPDSTVIGPVSNVDPGPATISVPWLTPITPVDTVLPAVM